MGSYVVRKSVLRKYDCLAVGSGYGCDQGSYDMTSDVTFWYNRIRGKEPENKLLDRLGGFVYILLIFLCAHFLLFIVSRYIFLG